MRPDTSPPAAKLPIQLHSPVQAHHDLRVLTVVLSGGGGRLCFLRISVFSTISTGHFCYWGEKPQQMLFFKVM